MDVTCEHCRHQLRIPDDKIPPGKTAALTCPSCKQRITVTGPSNGAHPVGEDAYDAEDQSFDFVEEEGKTALLCENDPEVLQHLTATMHALEYHANNVMSTRDALKQMRYHQYDVVVVNENFDTSNPDANGVLQYLERQPMDMRRNIFVCLISHRFRTMDNMMAFSRSVNLILNINDMDKAERALSRGIMDNEFFFRIYKESMKKTGKI